MKCDNADCPNLDQTQRLMQCSRCHEVVYCSKTCQTAHWKVHKKDCNPPPNTTPDKPFILLLSLSNTELFASVHSNLISSLHLKTHVIQASSTNSALQYLTSPSPHLKGVFITDEGIVRRKNSTILTNLIEWVRAGGIAVIGGLFSSFMRPNEFESFFEKWGLGWKMGDYHRTTFVLNPNPSSLRPSTPLPASYSMKAVHLKSINSTDAIYVPTPHSRVQSLVFAPTKVTNLEEAPVVYTKIGSGYLGYVGDVNAEEETTSVVLGMLRL